MARKIILKTEKVGETTFSYIEQLISFASSGVGGQPMSADDMFTAMPIVKLLKERKEEDAESVVLEDADWRFMRDRINGAQYPGYADQWIGLISAVRDADVVKVVELVKEEEA